jgi:hypothetical protein
MATPETESLMASSSRDRKTAARAQRTRKSPQSRIPEAFQVIESSPNDVPRLVLQGEWLKAVGFPIGAAAVLTTDRLGEMTLHRLGLSLPRRVRITRTRG